MLSKLGKRYHRNTFVTNLVVTNSLLSAFEHSAEGRLTNFLISSGKCIGKIASGVVVTVLGRG